MGHVIDADVINYTDMSPKVAAPQIWEDKFGFNGIHMAVPHLDFRVAMEYFSLEDDFFVEYLKVPYH